MVVALHHAFKYHLMAILPLTDDLSGLSASRPLPSIIQTREHYFGIEHPHIVSPYGYTTALQYLYSTVTARIVYKHISRIYVHILQYAELSAIPLLGIAPSDRQTVWAQLCRVQYGRVALIHRGNAPPRLKILVFA